MALKKYFPLFVMPTLLAFAIAFAVPFILGVFLSFTEFTTVVDAQWVGISNYIKAFSNDDFLNSLWFTVKFTVVSVITINIIAFVLASVLTKGLRGTNLFRTAFFMPNLVGGIVLGYIWAMIFDGILKQYDTFLIAETRYGFWGLVVLMCWQQVGYMMIIYIAGIQSVSEDMLEAARIDGANKWNALWRVTIPNMMSSFTICIFLTLTNSFKLFDQNLALTGGMPVKFEAGGKMVNTTQMLALNIYQTFYGSGSNRGVAQAKGVLFFLLVAMLALVQLKLTREKEVQQ
jgi:raffinose/stachyose/melibiose transport system permease protein